MLDFLSKSYVIGFFVVLSLLAGFLFGYSRGKESGRRSEQQTIIKKRVADAFKAANSPKALPLTIRQVDTILQAQSPGIVYLLGHRSTGNQKAFFYQIGGGDFISGWLRPRSLSLSFGAYPLECHCLI